MPAAGASTKANARPNRKNGTDRKFVGKRVPREKAKALRDKAPLKEYGQHKNGETRSFFINIGQLDNIQKGAITRLLCDQTGISNAQIGKIEILREFSFFEIDTQAADTVLSSMKHAKLDGRDVMVQLAQRRKPRAGTGTKTKNVKGSRIKSNHFAEGVKTAKKR